jgi:RNase P subunit RPR2
MAANRTVNKLLDQRKQIDGELKSIRSECAHYNQSIKQVHIREGSQADTRWVCDECGSIQGYPDKLELDKFLNNKK